MIIGHSLHVGGIETVTLVGGERAIIVDVHCKDCPSWDPFLLTDAGDAARLVAGVALKAGELWPHRVQPLILPGTPPIMWVKGFRR